MAVSPNAGRRIELVVEDMGYFWLSLDRAVGAPNVRLADLVRLHERLDAYADLLRLSGDLGWQFAVEALEAHTAGAVFPATCLALASGDVERLAIVFGDAGLGGAGQRDAGDVRANTACVISALALAERASAVTMINHLRISEEPFLRAVAIAALGTRRVDLGPVLASALTDPSPYVRARACRTIGQLGRADLMAQLRPVLTDPDPECRFWSGWAAARMGATEPLDTLADIAWNNLPRADRALDLVIRRLDVPQANAWLRDFAKLPDRQRSVMRATGVIGDPRYVPWLIERMADPATARLAGESFSMITGLDLAYRDLDRRPPADFQSGPNDDPADENVALDEDENLPWPDPARIGAWWTANRSRFATGTAYFLGTPKASADWLEALSDAFQRQRHAAALELAIRQPDKAMFEVRARGRLQRQLIARARGLA
jgi:uncharacterized protein (TIGR02270 family)